jgi:hypothetical protein
VERQEQRLLKAERLERKQAELERRAKEAEGRAAAAERETATAKRRQERADRQAAMAWRERVPADLAEAGRRARVQQEAREPWQELRRRTLDAERRAEAAEGRVERRVEELMQEERAWSRTLEEQLRKLQQAEGAVPTDTELRKGLARERSKSLRVGTELEVMTREVRRAERTAEQTQRLTESRERSASQRADAELEVMAREVRRAEPTAERELPRAGGTEEGGQEEDGGWWSAMEEGSEEEEEAEMATQAGVSSGKAGVELEVTTLRMRRAAAAAEREAELAALEEDYEEGEETEATPGTGGSSSLRVGVELEVMTSEVRRAELDAEQAQLLAQQELHGVLQAVQRGTSKGGAPQAGVSTEPAPAGLVQAVGSWWASAVMERGGLLEERVGTALEWEKAVEWQLHGGMNVEGGMSMLKYGEKADVMTEHFQAGGLAEALEGEGWRWRLECRGLVMRRVQGELQVVARPMPKMFSQHQLPRVTQVPRQHWMQARVVEATVKMDGALIFGVWVGEGGERRAELWTRSGRTKLAEAARVHAEAGDRAGASSYLGLLAEVESLGATACFEWTGRPVMVKVGYLETALVLTVIRDKVSGHLWPAAEVTAMGGRHYVPVVEEAKELAGLTVQAAGEMVRGWEGWEGAVVEVEGGMRIKLKSDWWMESETRDWRQWAGVSEQEQERQRRQRERQVREAKTQGQRLVLVGLPQQACPGALLGQIAGLRRVEAAYDKASGTRGAVVCGFKEEEQARRALEKGFIDSEWGTLVFCKAYSRLTASTQFI